MFNNKWIEDGFQLSETRDLHEIRRVLIVTMILNFAAMAVKLAAGILTGALSVVADALDSLFDGLSNVIGLAGLYAAAKPPDADHPYGHRKFETLAALSIAVLLFLTCYQLLISAWERLGSQHVPDVNLWVAGAMLVSMLIQAGTSFYELRAGRRLNSEILVADAMHTRASILISLSVLGGLGVVRLGFPQADPILAAIVALIIAKIGVDILRQNLPVLVDRAAMDPGEIARIVNEVGGIETFHRVRSRGAQGSAAVDLHVRVSPQKTLQEANAIGDEVRRRLLNLDGVSDVTVHIEPQRGMPNQAPDLFASIKQAASEMGINIHESYAHRIGEDLYVDLHVGLNPELTLGDAHALVDRFEHTLLERQPKLKGVHSHIELATNEVLVGTQASQELEGLAQQEVKNAIARIPQLFNPHNIRVRRDPINGGQIMISLDCSIAPDTPLPAAHLLASQLEQELISHMPVVSEVSVHLEPPE